MTQDSSESGKPKSPLVIDRKFEYSLENDAYCLIQELLPTCASCIAFIVYNPTSKQITEYVIDTYMKFVPAGVFSSEQQVIDWLDKIQVNQDVSAERSRSPHSHFIHEGQKTMGKESANQR